MADIEEDCAEVFLAFWALSVLKDKSIIKQTANIENEKVFMIKSIWLKKKIAMEKINKI
jgi:hypothetical protein